jgi:hypothetical protein
MIYFSISQGTRCTWVLQGSDDNVNSPLKFTSENTSYRSGHGPRAIQGPVALAGELNKFSPKKVEEALLLMSTKRTACYTSTDTAMPVISLIIRNDEDKKTLKQCLNNDNKSAFDKVFAEAPAAEQLISPSRQEP